MIEELRSKISPEVREQEPLAPHTTFKIGGLAEFFFEAKTTADVAKAVRIARELGVPHYVLGGGSNVLVSDDGVKGLVVFMACRDFRIDGTRVFADAGATPGLIAQKSVEAGLTGFEWAVGLPGTIGGAVRGNAETWGTATSDSVVSVRVLFPDGSEAELSNGDCRFAYRDSRFKHEPGLIILSAVLQLQRGADITHSRELLVRYLRQKQERQPVEFPSAGCMFKNWKPGSPDQLDEMAKFLDLNSDERVPLTPLGTVPAGWLIDRVGLKESKTGKAQMSEKHANFLVNLGGADAAEVVALASTVRMKVRDATGGIVQLEEEVEYVGF